MGMAEEGARGHRPQAPGTAPAAPPATPRFSVDYMDRSADPTVDFYRYANGRWIEQNPIPADKWGWTSFIELAERNHGLLHAILEECRPADVGAAGSTRRLVGDFYASAMDAERLEALGLAPIQPDLDEIGRLTSSGALFDYLARAHRRGIGGFFQTDVHPDEKASDRYALYLYQGGLSLPDRDYYLKPEFATQATAFREHLGRAFQVLGERPEEAAASARAVFELETELARSSRSRAELREAEKNYNPVAREELIGQHPSTPWTVYLASSGAPPKAPVVVGQPEFLEALDRLLAKASLGDGRAYLRWQLLHASAPYLNASVERADFELFQHVLLGQPAQEPRWLRSERVLDGAIGEALGSLYVERHFPKEARLGMVALVEDLCRVFRDRLARLGWMTEATRARALEKFDRFRAKIGHPERYRDYSSIRIERGDYLGNVWRAAAFETDRQLARVGQPVDREEWLMTPAQVNAYFDRTKNEIVFPAGILQPPYYELGADDAVNFGAIGAVIAHEITHGYDDQGRKYDRDGNLSDWWTESDAREFALRAARVVEQYHGYEGLPGLPVDGQLTLGENIADLGGVSIAFEALQRRLAADPSLRRPIDGLTPEQRFFLSWAQIWRENVRDDARRLRLTVDPHAPGRPRAIGPAVNLTAFAEAFGIRPGSPMWRPESERVSIW
jgi:putative endopeptidase